MDRAELIVQQKCFVVAVVVVDINKTGIYESINAYTLNDNISLVMWFTC